MKFNDHNDWHIPLDCGAFTVKDALASLTALGPAQQETPFIVKLMESPSYHLPGFTLFHGAVDAQQHAYIHILLGRGFLPKDEAFAMGFIMGSTNEVSKFEEELFCKVNQYFYPQSHRFHQEEVAVFKNGLRLGKISACQALNQVQYGDFIHSTVSGMRQALDVEEDLLRAYYRIEAQRYPDSIASSRLLHKASRAELAG